MNARARRRFSRAATLPQAPAPVQFFKGNGSWQYAIKVRGRWHWVGHERAVGDKLATWAQAHAVTLVRVQGIPAPLKALWARYGATEAAWADHLPRFEWGAP